MGSNMAENHPVGFQWVVEAKVKGAQLLHVDPRFTRTSAMADRHVGIRPGTDIAFLGGIINYILSNDRQFTEYVAAYTNGPAVLREDFRDVEDLDGIFSGYDPEKGSYSVETWQYQGMEVPSAAGHREQGASFSDTQGSSGAKISEGEPPEQDRTMQHPRCVFQQLKRHYARYTPEVVADICGIDPEDVVAVAEALCRNSGRERTSAIAYSVGWTHHTTGVQIIRAASIVQLLLGNIGRPGGGILALRGHASIQGSTDIPTLYNILPGYIPMPHSEQYGGLQEYVDANAAPTGYWGDMDAYIVSLLKSYYGDAATRDNDFRFDNLPRIDADHSTYQSVLGMLDGWVKGFIVLGENPAVGSANGRLHRLAMANLDWLVVKDLHEIETASFWSDSPEVDSGELVPADIGTEVFLLPASAHTEKDGSFTNTQRLLQWHRKAVEPKGDARSDLWFIYHLGRKIREKLAGSTERRDRPVLELTWDYPTEGPHEDPSAETILAEINGFDGDGQPLSGYTELKADGSTSCGCWIYCGCYAHGVNQPDRRKPGAEQDWVAPEWGWAWPMNRRILYNRASADPDGKPWSERKRYVWWDPEANDGDGQWTGPDVPDFNKSKRPDYTPSEDAEAEDAIAGDEPFIMQADGKGWLFAPNGLKDGPFPAHYEAHESPVRNPLYSQQANPARQTFERRHNRSNPSAGMDGADVYPYVLSTYRIAEHHTAGGMSRFGFRLSELAPEFFCEVSPALAAERGLEHGGWATIVTARTAVEARVMVTERVPPYRLDGREVHQVGVPYHWGYKGVASGDSGNDLTAIALDPNVHISEFKVASCDIVPGRRPRGADLPAYVAAYRRRAGIADDEDMA